MWIITSDAFVSIVEHRDNPDLLIVRGRFAGDVSRFLGMKSTLERETPAADYRFRIITRRDVVERAMARQLKRVRYPNFKDSIAQAWRKALAMRVWSIFHEAQERLRGFRDVHMTAPASARLDFGPDFERTAPADLV